MDARSGHSPSQVTDGGTHAQENSRPANVEQRVKRDADYIFHELTRSICPQCKAVIDAQIIIRDNKVFMRKRCPDHGWFEGIISSDAEMYVDSIKFNKPGTLPLEFSTEVAEGCPLDCGLCPEHKQHICLGLIEVNTACNLNCPVCFADAGIGYSLTMSQVRADAGPVRGDRRRPRGDPVQRWRAYYPSSNLGHDPSRQRTVASGR